MKVLDVGCGRGIWGFLMLSERGEPQLMVGLDIQRNNLDFCRKHYIYNELVLGDARYLPFRDKCFDIVLASEVIEHILKHDGLKLLDECERVYKGRVIITCPQGYAPRSEVEGREVESHKSQWVASEFRKRGYKVNGIGFRLFKLHKGVKTSLRLYGALFYIFTPFSYVFPELGEYLIAIKEAKGRTCVKG